MSRLHPEMQAALADLQDACMFIGSEIMQHRNPRAVAWMRQWEVAPGVLAVPFLSEQTCDELVQYAKLKAAEYVANAEEEQEFQIPELVLAEHDQALHSQMLSLFQSALVPVFQLMHGRIPAMMTSIQLAHYNPQGTSHGNWHHDDDSDQTAVVSLDPCAFTGGGTDIATEVITGRYITVPPLPKGYALCFNGKMTLHRGRHVESGDRHLLVYWTEGK